MKRLLRSLAVSAALMASVSATASGTPEYGPRDETERGLWQQMDEYERELKTSEFLMTDPALNAYVKGVLCKAVGTERCGATRIYIVRTPQYNAMMAPNGMMIVWSGLLLRTRNEAELATVLGHEFAHFEKRHSIQMYNNIKSKTDAMTWLSVLPGGFLAQMSLMGSVMSFNRDMERQADLVAVDDLARSGYDPIAASEIWEQLRAEMDSTAQGKRMRKAMDNAGDFFSSHPNSKERMEYLRAAATGKRANGQTMGAESYRRALAPWWPELINDQIKLNQFGATEFLLNSMARGKWSADLLYARGELYRARGKDGDFASAIGFYKQAIAQDATLAESYRGLGVSQMRSGSKDEGKKSLKLYLEKRPLAGDHGIVTMMATGS
ncbi:MAG: M48 family metalloprotease [Sphingorhabdus sp.]